MSKSFITGFPRIGEQRELKRSLEAFWSGKIDQNELLATASELKERHIDYQIDASIDLISVNDFSLYDIMLDHICLFGAIAPRFSKLNSLEQYFAMARGAQNTPAMEMTKWFNTNYHYIVPELSKDTKFTLNAQKIIDEYKQARTKTENLKINLIGPITFLALSKSTDSSPVFEKLNQLVECYEQLLKELSALDDEVIIQIDEPIFVTDNDQIYLKYLDEVYTRLCGAASNVKIIFMTYFEQATQAVKEIIKTPVWAIGLDFVHADFQKEALLALKDTKKVLFAGVIDGRNVWRCDLEDRVEIVKQIREYVPTDRLFIGTSCSLLHLPYTLKYETNLNPKIKSWLSFACEKLIEVKLLNQLVNGSSSFVIGWRELEENENAAISRKNSTLIHDKNVTKRLENLDKFERELGYEERIKIQKELLDYPLLPTTTIGSFPQTSELRAVRNAYKKGLIDRQSYESDIKKYIDECILFQEEIGLDVLVHGEPERNDMVEYFGEQLKGYAFSENGWVQSYGSRCVKPPLLFGDVSRPTPMSVEWITYAQSRTKKIMKGMLTGPVTIMNWSFVRDDKPRFEIVKQIALAICDEIDDLQNAGIKIIQVDEAAFKEGYPLRKAKKEQYEKFAVDAFKLSVSSAKPKTQIHTHMCYSDFNDCIKTIEAMDADVISIETARSGNKLLKIFKDVGYKQEIGPGVYDIHSPQIPTVEELVSEINLRLRVLPKSQTWINPDCGLKTRKWEEVKASLKNMVQAANIVREG